MMHCYEQQGFRSRIICPISGAIIDFLGEIYVDNTDLIITRPEFTTEKETQEGLREAAWALASGLNATGGVINPEKSRWIYAGYEWANGSWAYAKHPDLPMEIPLPGGLSATMSQAEVSTVEKALGVWSTVEEDNSIHLAKNVTGRFTKLASKMTNGHLPARLGWIAYRFKLWPGIRYGLSTLAMPLATAQDTLQKNFFRILPFLGINRNVKQEWRTLNCTFWGIGLLDLAVEHTIGMINIFVQHYGAGTTVALKYSASLEALQLEIGCTGNPLEEDYERYQWLATESWVESFWEQLHYYHFHVYLDYTSLKLPRRNGATLVGMFWQAGYRTQQSNSKH
jgi:hypothetical protein